MGQRVSIDVHGTNDYPEDIALSNSISKNLYDFLTETELYMEQLDTLSFYTATELYDLLDEAAKTATMQINNIDPELRVTVCDRLDKVLDRIVDNLPPFENNGDKLGVYSPAIHEYRKWKNVDLLKDCGLAVYMLAKELKATPVMYFCTKPSDYPYLDFLPDMKLLYNDFESELEDAYKDYLLKHSADIDVIIFYGMYNQALSYLDVYRKLRPDGKAYCGLDMNRWWIEKISWESTPGKLFAEQCDIIATSCRLVRDTLNRNPKVQFPCRWFTNGFFNTTNNPVTADADKKSNIILTVGRIGTVEKNNEELLSAFAQISDIIKGWNLRLVGPIEPEFRSYINNYYTEYPHLKDRVVFTGSIIEKAKLFDEYAGAKIFALTSKNEGFPNVYAEALFHGCMFVTSDIDAADDITNYGELGVKYLSGDTKALQDELVDMCCKADITYMQNHIPKALKYANKYYDWNRNAKKLAYMLYK